MQHLKEVKMKNDTNVVICNIKNELTTSNGKEPEHLYSDALVIHKNGSNFLLTIHGDYTETLVDYDGGVRCESGYKEHYASKAMYEIKAIEAKILLNMSPKSKIFNGVLNRIQKRQNLMNVNLKMKETNETKEIRETIMKKDKELALSKQVEYGNNWKQTKAMEENLKKEKELETEKYNGLKVAKILEKFAYKK